MMAYLVGVMLGDGGVYGKTYTVFCRDRDLEFVESIAALVEKLFKIKPNIRKAAPNCYIASTNKKSIHQFFVENGFPKGRKLINARIPKIFLKNLDDRIAVIRGLFDAEGYCGIDRQRHGDLEYEYPYIGLDMISGPLVKEIQVILSELEIESNVAMKKVRGWGRHPQWSLVIKGESRIEKFRQKVGFQHPAKVKRLDAILERGGSSETIRRVPTAGG